MDRVCVLTQAVQQAYTVSSDLYLWRFANEQQLLHPFLNTLT